MKERRVALVTGGRRGIGRGIARALAADGLTVAVCGRSREEDSRDVVEELERLGAEAMYVSMDVSDADSRRRGLEAVEERFGGIDVLVNNAGIAPRVRAEMLEATEESFEEVMKVNLQGPYFLTQAVARRMIRKREQDPSFRGCIVNITSISAVVASTNRGEYCISKAGLSMATRLWAVALAPFGIDVYEVRPGIIETDMTAGVKEKYDRLISEGLLLQPRWGTPEDVGKAVAALVRGELGYSTGAVIPVDGGLMIRRL